MNKILIFGKGFIGNRLQKVFNCDITDRIILKLQDAQEELEKYNPDVVINCIGITGVHNVDGCELDKENTLIANTFVPIMLAEAALRKNIKLVHISSGCIFHYDYAKDSSLDEERVPDYFDLYYSRSKIYSERALLPLVKQYNILIVRLRIPLDNRPSPKNLLDKLIKYRKVIDVPNSVAYIPDFVQALQHLISIDAKGIFNVVNSQGLRYPDLMEVYKKYKPDFTYEVIPLERLKLNRTNLVLSTEKLGKSGFKVRPINAVLEECVKEYLKY